MSDNETQQVAVAPADVASSTITDATRSLDSADALSVAQMRQAELARDGGPRTTLLNRISSSQQGADDALIAQGSGIDASELQYAADYLGVDIGIMRATFAFLGRKRVSEDELRAAVAHVGAREV